MNDQIKRPGGKRVVIVENMNDRPPAEPGVVYISKAKWKKLQRRQQTMEHTATVVCRWCWLDGHGQHRDAAAAGTLAKNKETHLYEHAYYCPGMRDRDIAASELRKP